MSQRAKPFERQLNICIKVDEFDNSGPMGGVAKGVVVSPAWFRGEKVSGRLLTKDENTATFRSGYDAKSNENFFRRRATMENFEKGYKVGSNMIEPVQKGGFIMLHGCIRDRELSTPEQPVWKAQYIENYGKEQDRAILQGAGRVEVRTVGESTYANLDLMQVDNSEFVYSMSDVTRFYEQHMQGSGVSIGNDGAELVGTKQPLAMVRIAYQDGSSKSAFAYAERVAKEVKDVDGKDLTIKVPGSHTESMAAAFLKGEQGRGFFRFIGGALSDEILATVPEEVQPMALALRKDIEADRARIEMIPGARIPIVGKSFDDLMNEKHQLNRVASKCWVKVEGRDGAPDESRLGFIKMTVSVMTGRSNIPGETPNFIVSKFTEDEFAKARTASMLATPLFNPVFTQQRDHEAAQRAEKAASLGGVPHGEPEMEAPEQPSLSNEKADEAEYMAPGH